MLCMQTEAGNFLLGEETRVINLDEGYVDNPRLGG